MSEENKSPEFRLQEIQFDISKNLYHLDEPMKLFIGNGVIKNFINDYPDIDYNSAFDELENINKFVFFNYRQPDKPVCSFCTENFSYVLVLSYPEEVQKNRTANLCIIAIFAGKEMQKDKNRSYHSASFKVAVEVPENETPVWIRYDRKNINVPDDYRFDMEKRSELLDAIKTYFESVHVEETNHVSKRFNNNVLNYVRQYNEIEYRRDLNASNKANGTPYNSRKVIGDSSQTPTYSFYCPLIFEDDDDEALKSGNMVIVQRNANSEDQQDLLQGQIIDVKVSDDPVGTVYTVEFRRQFDDSEIPETGELKLAASKTQYAVRNQVIRGFEKDYLPNKYMYSFGQNFRPKPFNNKVEQEADAFIHELNSESKYPLNDRQAEAIKKGILTQDILLVQGPPGTGKTTVITDWVRYFTGKKKRVLVSSQNNAAVDNVLERIGSMDGVHAIRIGNPSKVQDNCLKYLPQNQREIYLGYINQAYSNFNDTYQKLKYNVDLLDQNRDLWKDTLSEAYRLLVERKKWSDEQASKQEQTRTSHLNDQVALARTQEDIQSQFKHINSCKISLRSVEEKLNDKVQEQTRIRQQIEFLKKAIQAQSHAEYLDKVSQESQKRQKEYDDTLRFIDTFKSANFFRRLIWIAAGGLGTYRHHKAFIKLYPTVEGYIQDCISRMPSEQNIYQEHLKEQNGIFLQDRNLNDMISQLNSEKNKLSADISVSTDRLAHYQEECRILQARITDLESKIANLEAEKIEKEKKYGAAVEELRTKIPATAELNLKDCPITLDLSIEADIEKMQAKIEKLENVSADIYRQFMKYNALKPIEDDWHALTSERENHALADIVINESNVVGATCIGINSNRDLKDLNFDVSIIDECGQIQIHNCIVPMSRAPINLLLGDQFQIPPMADQEMVEICNDDGVVSSELLNKSFFEYIFDKMNNYDDDEDHPVEKHSVLLNTQFRFPHQISDIVKDKFYHGDYKAGLKFDDWKSLLPGMHSPLIVIDTSDSRLRIETSGNRVKGAKGGARNDYEAWIIVEAIKVLMQNPAFLSDSKGAAVPFEESLGVISPYGLQVRRIREFLRKARIRGLDSSSIDSAVASLDSFQGQERPIIFFSCTRSNNIPEDKNRIGFMKELRRLNVAFTRCKKQLVIVGDMNFLTSCKSGSEAEFSEFMKKDLIGKIHNDHIGEIIPSQEFLNRIGAELKWKKVQH